MSVQFKRRHLPKGVHQAARQVETLENRRLFAGASHLIFSTLDGQMGDVNLTAVAGLPAGSAYNVRPLPVIQPIDLVRDIDGALLTLAGSGNFNSTSLVQVNQATGAVSEYRSNNGRIVFNVAQVTEGDLAVHPTTGDIFGVQSIQDGKPTLFRAVTYDQSIRTPIIGPVQSPTYAPTDISGLEFVPANLFGLGGDYVLVGLGGTSGNTDSLFLINPQNGAVTNVVPLSKTLAFSAGFVRDPATGDCYVADGGGNTSGSLYRLNPVTGVLTLIGSLNLPGGASGLALGEDNDSEPNVGGSIRASAVPDLVYAPLNTAASSIDFAGDTDLLPYSSMTVEPIGAPSFLQLKLEVLNAQGQVVTTAVAPAAGAPVYLSVPPAGPATQGYLVRVSDASGNGLLGYYRVSPFTNASVEAEAIGATVNDSLATAQNIDVSSLALDSQGQSTRLAVRGFLNDDPAAQDWFSFTVNPNEPITVGLEQSPENYVLFAPDLTQVLKLDLYDAAGNLLISGFDPGASRLAYEQVVQNFVANINAPTLLYARITNDPAATTPAGKAYDLVVVRNADLEIETNDPAASPPQPLELRPGFGARLLGDQRFRNNLPDVDDYTIQLEANRTIQIQLDRPSIPFTGMEFNNVPRVRLLDPSGTQVAEGIYQNNLKVTLSYTPAVAGVYRIKVVGEADRAGEYVLSVGAPAVAPGVYGRKIFYNNSSFDGNDAGAGAADDAAVAVGKAVLLPGVKANTAHYSSYTKGINGVMIDLGTLAAGTTLTADDFVIRSGKGDPSTFDDGPAPTSVTIRRAAGTGGGDRVTLIWADGQAVTNGWLRVTTKANARTGLASPDTFYFGNLIGDTADNDAAAAVNASDLVAVRNAIGTGVAGVASRFDFNRDGKTDASDLVIVRNTIGHTLPLFTAPTSTGLVQRLWRASAGLFAERKLDDERNFDA